MKVHFIAGALLTIRAFRNVVDNGWSMPLDWSCGALAEGLRCYRTGEFFLAHEHWEDVWRVSPQPEKTFLQALIQIAAAFHHLKRNNTAGAQSLLKSALVRLESLPPVFEDVSLIDLRKSIVAWLRALELDEPGLRPAFPELNF